MASFLVAVAICFLWLVHLGSSWEATSLLPSTTWTCVAVSGDGTNLYAASDSNGVYQSTDGATTWNKLSQIPSNNFRAVSTSYNGSVVVLAGYNSNIYVSHDFGASLNVTAGVSTGKKWYTVAMSDNGAIIYAGTFDESLYWSQDYGKTFSLHPFAISTGFYSVDCDSTGASLVLSVRGNYPVYFSNSSGYNVSHSSATPSVDYAGVALSKDGSVIVALATFSGIYVSRDFGRSWQFTSTSQTLRGVACDMNCTRIVVATTNSYLIQSFNQGLSWRTIRSVGQRTWIDVASDVSGALALAAVYGGSVFVGDLYPSPTQMPTMVPTAIPTISFAPSPSPTTGNNADATSAQTRMIQQITIIIICVLGGTSCGCLMFMRSCKRGGWLFNLWQRYVINPYRSVAGPRRGNDGMVIADIQLVPTADRVEVLETGIEPSPSTLAVTAPRASSSSQSADAVVATAVVARPPTAVAIRTFQV